MLMDTNSRIIQIYQQKLADIDYQAAQYQALYEAEKEKVEQLQAQLDELNKPVELEEEEEDNGI